MRAFGQIDNVAFEMGGKLCEALEWYTEGEQGTEDEEKALIRLTDGTEKHVQFSEIRDCSLEAE